MNDQIILGEVEKIRAKNNKLWMRLLALALEACPSESKKIIREITKNDRRVSKWLSKL